MRSILVRLLGMVAEMERERAGIEPAKKKSVYKVFRLSKRLRRAPERRHHIGHAILHQRSKRRGRTPWRTRWTISWTGS
jgi:hypothetical protein